MEDSFREHVARHDVISFDVFDTLVLRAIAKPADVFGLVKAKLIADRTALLNPELIDTLPDLRVRAERLARDAKQRADGHGEIPFDDIYATLAGLSGAGADVIALLKDTELEIERRLVYPNPEIVKLFAYARHAGKRVVLCSDMYLPAGDVRDLLRRCGVTGYDELYVSGEHARSKELGTMYRYVAAQLGVSPAAVLHVGDNPHGDLVMAERAGCTAFHVPYESAVPAVATPWAGDPPFNAGLVTAVIAGLVRKRLQHSARRATDPCEELGFRVFGPLFTGFLLWLRIAIAQKRPDRVLLFARDAHVIASQLSRFIAGPEPLPRIDYVYVSRGALLFPSLTDFPPQRLNHFFSGRAKRSVARHLRRFGLEPELFAGVVRSAGFASVDDLVRNGDPRMRDLLGKLHHVLLRESARRRPLVRDYLAQFVEHDDRDVMLVDVGWVGNMQTSFARLLGSARPDMKTRGYYVGVFASALDNALPGHTMSGWLTNPGDPPHVERNMWWSGGVELLELAMSAPHGTTLGYERRSDGTVAPVIESSADEEDTQAVAARLQRGALAFVDEFVTRYGDIPPDGLNSRAWGAAFYQLVTDPSPGDIELLGDLTHGDAAGDTAVRLPLAPKVADAQAAGDAVESCYWKSAFILRNGLEDDESFNEGAYLALYPDVRAAVDGGVIPTGLVHWVANGNEERRIASWAAWLRRQRGAGAHG